MKMKTLLRIALAALVLAVFAPAAHAQASVKNPTSITFTSPDHAQATGYEVDILDASGVAISTTQAGHPTANTDGTVTVTINVQPIKFGPGYTFVVRATADGVKSDDSPKSDPFERVPGKPGKPVAK